jgi:hypothetical protein
MASGFDDALQRALSVRLNLQVGLSSMPAVEEWMDIHLDRFLEHVPMPPEMPDGHAVSYLASFGSDLSRLFWGAWGHPRGFIPKMAPYFKLCEMARADEAIIDQIGGALEPQLVGMWVGVTAGKVITGWHIGDPHPWEKIEPLFGTHAAKQQLVEFVGKHGIPRIERFQQSIGDAPYSELELRLPGASAAAQVAALDDAFDHFTGAKLPAALTARVADVEAPEVAIAVRIRAGQIVKVGALVPGVRPEELAGFCAAGEVTLDDKVLRVVGSLSGDGGIARLEYARAGKFAGVDVFVEPGDAPPAALRSAISRN